MDDSGAARRTARGWRRWAVALLAGLVTSAALGALALCVLVPRAVGGTPYAVLTGSMSPRLATGSLVVTRPEPVETIAVGDVVTYQLLSGRAPVVTHRVVAKGRTMGGETVLRTQGDANDDADVLWVRPEQVRGKVWYGVPHLGRLHTWLTARQHALLSQLAAGGLAVHSLTMFSRAMRERRARRATRTAGVLA